MTWKYTDESNKFVWRENPDGSQETRPANHPDILAWLAAGNTPLPHMSAEDQLTEAKAKRIAEVEKKMAAMQAQGLEYPQGSGRFVQIRAQDIPNITGAAGRAESASRRNNWPTDFIWIMADNAPFALPLSDDMTDMGEAAFDEIRRLRYVTRQHKDAILALATKEAVQSYDINGGW
jgi:hypothetical protein